MTPAKSARQFPTALSRRTVTFAVAFAMLGPCLARGQ